MAVGGVLRYTMVVRDPETLAPVALLGGDPVPGWASGLVSPDDLEPQELTEEPAGVNTGDGEQGSEQTGDGEQQPAPAGRRRKA